MSNMRKLSAFRQLSLNCEPPNLEQRRKSLKKQFSEDIPETKDHWPDSGYGIKVSLNNKSSKNFINVPPIKIAWGEDPSDIKADDAVIIKKCTELRRTPSGKLSRQTSLENDSILQSKQELAERIRQIVTEKELPEKHNIKIFLTHSTNESQEEKQLSNQKDLEQYLDKPSEQPKLIPPLVTNNVSNKPFQIRKNLRPKTSLSETTYSRTSTIIKTNARLIESNAVVVVPIVENEEHEAKIENFQETLTQTAIVNNEDSKAINSVVIRPNTAAFRREKFQKRTNSAFNATVKEITTHARPPLIRSSSAPVKANNSKSKFIASKRKVKTVKRIHNVKSNINNEEEVENINEENLKNQKMLNKITDVHANEVVTMVSLISPSGSDCEEESAEETKEKCTNLKNVKVAAKEEETPAKMLTLRKAVKSVSFQQSSIHAIRSFSASFPARRSSVATALMLGNNNLKSTAAPTPKSQEKRSTNSTTPDDDERVPKRRLVRSNTKENAVISDGNSGSNKTEAVSNSGFSVDIKAKNAASNERKREENQSSNQSEKSATVSEETASTSEANKEEEEKSPKEKQCWNLYCKMTEKGINVSFDTILRGMLTPTEYRISKKKFVETTEVLENVPENSDNN